MKKSSAQKQCRALGLSGSKLKACVFKKTRRRARRGRSYGLQWDTDRQYLKLGPADYTIAWGSGRSHSSDTGGESIIIHYNPKSFSGELYRDKTLLVNGKLPRGWRGAGILKAKDVALALHDKKPIPIYPDPKSSSSAPKPILIRPSKEAASQIRVWLDRILEMGWGD